MYRKNRNRVESEKQKLTQQKLTTHQEIDKTQAYKKLDIDLHQQLTIETAYMYMQLCISLKKTFIVISAMSDDYANAKAVVTCATR